ncbi:MAG: hypothetical protein H7232_19145 [Aeromicrobium sp.]|nr:hypothetical protein [Burkholderiales bacterium]
MQPTSHFPRPLEANGYVQSLLGLTPPDFWSYGFLYLAAPPGTGKSDFLAYDLVPALMAHGALPVCVTTAFDQPFTPGELIADAIERAIAICEKRPAPDSPTLGLASVDTARRRKVHWSTLRTRGELNFASALRRLHQIANKPIVLVIDNAHHARAGAPGRMAIAAIKAARFELHRDDHITVFLLMIGSDKERLRRIEEALHGRIWATLLSQLPPLQDTFVRKIAVDISITHPSDTPLDVARLIDAFKLFDSQPSLFVDAISRASSRLSDLHAVGIEACILQASKQYQTDQDSLKDACFGSLTPLSRAILTQIFESVNRFEPFQPRTLVLYCNRLGAKVTAAHVQSAMTGLCRRTPALIWSWKKGGYAIADDAWRRWYERRVSEKNWPPPETTTRALCIKNTDT